MKLEEFAKEIEIGVQQTLGDYFCVKVNHITKNNAVILTGISIEEKEKNIHPNIYINDFYREFEHGKAINDIIAQVIAAYQEGKIKEPLNMDFFKEFDKVKANIMFKLINYEKNKALLKAIPYIPILDLAIVFYYRLHNKYFHNASIQITNIHTDMWKVTKEELLNYAKYNTSRLLPVEIKNMEAILKETLLLNLKEEFSNAVNRTMDTNLEVQFAEQHLEEIVEQMLGSVGGNRKENPMYVLTNQAKINGASCIFYKNVLNEFAENMQKDIYILPSSVHEVILIPTDKEEESEQLSQMVREVNKTELELEEVLSDNVYYYSRETREIRLCGQVK